MACSYRDLITAGYKPEQIISCPGMFPGGPCPCELALSERKSYPKNCQWGGKTRQKGEEGIASLP